MAHDGYARTMRPAHTMLDGDTIFTLSVGSIQADISAVGALASPGHGAGSGFCYKRSGISGWVSLFQ